MLNSKSIWWGVWTCEVKSPYLEKKPMLAAALYVLAKYSNVW